MVFLAVKSQQSLAALSGLAAVAPQSTPIVCLQNGIANEPAALRLFPNMYGASVACPTSHLEPGVAQIWSTPVTGLLDIGRYPGGIDEARRDPPGGLLEQLENSGEPARPGVRSAFGEPGTL